MKNKWLFLYGFLMLAVLLGGIYLAKDAQIWQVSGKINPDGSRVTIQGNDVNEIKGWTTLAMVIEGYNLDKEEVYRDFELTDDISLDTKLSELATITDERLSPSIMRDYISEKKGLAKQDETAGKNKEEDSENKED